MKTSELTGAALDWAVSQAEKLDYEIVDGAPVTGATVYTEDGLGFDEVYEPSTNWAQGGPIIERERIWACASHSSGNWFSECPKTERQWGPTSLIAAMRCYVASKLGEEVDVPEELT